MTEDDRDTAPGRSGSHLTAAGHRKLRHQIVESSAVEEEPSSDPMQILTGRSLFVGPDWLNWEPLSLLPPADLLGQENHKLDSLNLVANPRQSIISILDGVFAAHNQEFPPLFSPLC